MLEIPNVELLAPTASGEATLESVRAHDPEVLVMDARILDGKGKELLKTVRKEKPAIVVIILSNVVSPQSRKHYEAAGADLFLDKSYEFIHLYQFVRELVCSPQTEEDRARKDGIRKRLARTKLLVGLQLLLFVFSASSLFISPRARGVTPGLVPAGGGGCPYARKVAVLLEGKLV
jgi:DNA-binding response OmpR family regulator